MANKNNQTAGQAAQAQTASSADASAQQPAISATASTSEQADTTADDEEKIALREQVQSLTEQLATSKQESATLQDQLTSERTRSGELADDLNTSENLIEDLQRRLETAGKLQEQSDTVIVSDGTDHYKVLARRFKFKHVEYSAEQLRSDQELVRTLVAAQVGFLHKIDPAT